MDGVLLRGGLVYDGSGADGVRQDVLIVEDSVRQVGPDLDAPAEGVTVIDCTDLAVAPGFIDIHGHSDFSLLAHPLAESRVAAGVTTEVAGNCGVSPFPLGGQLTERRRLQLVSTGVDPTWTDARGYCDAVARTGCSMNIAFLVGHGNLRAVAAGYEDRPVSADELDTMKRLLVESLDAGAYGMSTGLVYAPGCYATIEEVTELARVVGRRGGIYASHVRNEGPRLIEAAREFLAIVEASGCRGMFSHIKTMGPTNWHKVDELIAMITEARQAGADIFADRYPYLASNTGLDSLLFPNWVVEGTVDEELGRLGDPALQDRLRQALAQVRPEPDWPDRVRLCGCATQKNAALAGLSLGELAERWKTEPPDAAIRLLIEEQTHVTAVLFGMSEDNLRRFYRLPFVIVSSDSSVRGLSTEGNARPHPRAFGTPARFLATYVRDEALMTWGEGIHKLTGLPARVMGWQRRGRLTRGAVADVTVFDPDRLADRATYDQPIAAPVGIRHVLVAGQRILTDGQHTGAKPGRIIKRGEPE